MVDGSNKKKTLKLIIALVVAVAIAIPVGTAVYINLIRDDAPARLTDSQASQPPEKALGDVSGTWTPIPASQVGYRVPEILFGQETTAVGRTNRVTGDLVLQNNTVNAVNLQADMASVTSDQNRRDNQFRTRIMSTDRFPTATYKLDQPIALPRTPDANPQTVKANGTLTLRGTAKAITSDLTVKQVAGGVEVSGLIPVKFSDYGIPSPSFGPAQVGESGELELKVIFAKAS